MTSAEMENRLAEEMHKLHERASSNLAGMSGIQRVVGADRLAAEFGQSRLHRVHPLALWLCAPADFASRALGRLDASVLALDQAQGSCWSECLPSLFNQQRTAHPQFFGTSGQLNLARQLMQRGRPVQLEPRLPNCKRSDIRWRGREEADDWWVEVWTPEERQLSLWLESAFVNWKAHHHLADTLKGLDFTLDLPPLINPNDDAPPVGGRKTKMGVERFDEMFCVADGEVAAARVPARPTMIWQDGAAGVSLHAVPEHMDGADDGPYGPPWGTAIGQPEVPEWFVRKAENAIRGKAGAGQFAIPSGSMALAVDCHLVVDVGAILGLFGGPLARTLDWHEWGPNNEVDELWFFYDQPGTDSLAITPIRRSGR